MGRGATGSRDLGVGEAFVAEYGRHSYGGAVRRSQPGNELNDAPLFRLPFGIVFPNGIVAPAIGVALGALEAFREQSGRRINLRDQSRIVEDPFIQLRLAEAAAEVSGARDRLLGNFAEMMRIARAGEEIPLTQR